MCVPLNFTTFNGFNWRFAQPKVYGITTLRNHTFTES